MVPPPPSNFPTAHPSSSASTNPSNTMLRDNGTNLIARAEALNAFMRMQPAANQARLAATVPNPLPHPPPSSPTVATESSCLCFGRTPPISGISSSVNGTSNTTREYYPDNLSVQPEPHPWEDRMEWLIIACIDLLETSGLHEQNLFAVSAVDDLVRQTSVPHLSPMLPTTDPHVAAGVIKAKIRHANEPLIDRTCLRHFIDKSNSAQQQQQQQQQLSSSSTTDSTQQTSSSEQQSEQKQQQKQYDYNNEHGSAAISGGGSSLAVASHSGTTFRESHLAKTIDATNDLRGPRRAYILARFMRLLGRVSASVEQSRMNSHSLAKCVAPSMLHWDPNTNFALLMLGRITAYVMTLIEDARVFDENLCKKIDQLATKGAW